MTNVPIVEKIYAAFGRGDVPSVLAVLDDDVDCDYGLSDTGVPWLQPRKGRAEAAKFFAALGAVDLQQFKAKTIFEHGNIVVVLIDVALVVKATGRKVVEEDEVHIGHFDTKGRVIRFSHKLDTHQHWAAYKDR